jgi:transposase, IS6 family
MCVHCASIGSKPSQHGSALNSIDANGEVAGPALIGIQQHCKARKSQFGQVIDVFVSPRRDVQAARRFFKRALGTTKIMPTEVTTDRAPVYPAVREELLPAAWHRTDRYANNGVGCDHGRLKARLRPMRGLKQDRSAKVIIAGHALVQNVRRGHYELAVEESTNRRVAVAFDELALAI